jgi:glycosyltransferase involved in cell wall biosynthesis
MCVSVLILTLNEEVNLPACLESVSWSDDVVVLDSFSTDRTAEIAAAAGARVVQRKFDDWSSHQNWAVRNIDFRHPWVYYSDADERVTPKLAREVQSIAADGQRQEVAYRVRFTNMFMGREIRHASLYPTWVLRFFRPEKVRWERLVNPVAVVDGPQGRLQAHFEHYSFNKGLAQWFAKHNLYSSDEARELIRTIDRPIRWRGVLSGDPCERRAVMKSLAYRLPLRPVLVFCYLYFLRLGLLDGLPGLTYCHLRAMFEYMVDLKVKEFKRKGKGLAM